MSANAPAAPWWRATKVAAHELGVFRLLARRRPWPGAVVLCYHAIRASAAVPDGLTFAGLHVPAPYFAQHLDVIRRLGMPIGLSQLVAGLQGRSALPARAIHVTFDDGYRSVLTRALPLLERANVPASLFLSRRPIEQRTLHWYDAMARQLGDEAVMSLRDGGAANWPDVVAKWSPPAGSADELATLTPDEVSTLASHPLIELGSHTDSHPPLAQLDIPMQASEIARGIEAVTSWTGHAASSFAYPIGRPRIDYNGDTMEVLRRLGVAVAFTTGEGWASASRPLLEQPRFLMVDGLDGAELAYRLARRWQP